MLSYTHSCFFFALQLYGCNWPSRKTSEPCRKSKNLSLRVSGTVFRQHGCFHAHTFLSVLRKQMVRFAFDCLNKVNEITKELEGTLGPDTADLSMRFGLHSGPVTAGVLRGERWVSSNFGKKYIPFSFLCLTYCIVAGFLSSIKERDSNSLETLSTLRQGWRATG